MDSIGGYAIISGAAKLLGSTYWTVREYIFKRRISTIRLTGSQAVLVKVADLEGLRNKKLPPTRKQHTPAAVYLPSVWWHPAA